MCQPRFADGTFDFHLRGRPPRPSWRARGSAGVVAQAAAGRSDGWPLLHTDQLEPRSFWVDLDKPMMSKSHADPERSNQNWTCASRRYSVAILMPLPYGYPNGYPRAHTHE